MIYDINGNPLDADALLDGVFPVLDPARILTVTNPSQMYTTFSDVYSAYDSILADVPHDKNLLGYGTNASGGQDTTLPIYEYAIYNPLNLSYPDHPAWAAKPAPKICLTSGVHGNERGAVVALMNVIRMIITGTDSVSRSLRNSAEYRVVPVINPGGYNDNTRDTRHGVNLNRNFGWNWGPGEHPGSSAYSEYESQALKAWCDAQAPTTLFMIDCHNHLASQTDNIFYVFTDVPRWKDAFCAVARGMINHYAAESIDLTDYAFWQQGNLVAGIAEEFQMIHGVESGGIETPNNPYSTANTWVKPSAEIQGTFIRYMLDNFNYKSA